MSVALLDVNVLVALFDPAHLHHEAAHLWFGRNRKHGWATCPITINGCVRVLSSPAYLTVDATPGEVAERLRSLCAAEDHQFWPDSVALFDASVFRSPMIGGSKKVTDVYLLGLAVRNHGKLVTFDRAIPIKAVTRATASHLIVLG